LLDLFRGGAALAGTVRGDKLSPGRPHLKNGVAVLAADVLANHLVGQVVDALAAGAPGLHCHVGRPSPVRLTVTSTPAYTLGRRLPTTIFTGHKSASSAARPC